MSIKVGEIYAAYKTEGWDAFRKEITGSERLMAGAAIGMVASMAAITAAVVKIGMPFETMVLEAGSAMRATQAEMERLEAAARRAGATTEHTATQAAESLKFLGKAGLTARESMESLGGMLNFKTAIGSVMDLGRATDVITDSMISMGLETKDLTHLTDLFVGASNRSSTNAAQIGEAFSKVAGIAKVYGMEVETLTATIAIQASAGIKSGIAGRQLKNAFAAASTAAAELGIKNEGLIPTLRAVEKAGWDADKVMGTFGRIAMPSVVAIMSKVSGTEKGSFAYMLNEMNHVSDGMGETAIQAEKMRTSVENQFAIVTSMIQDIALSIFDDWKPAMLDGIKTTQDFLRENKKAIVEVGDVLLPVLKSSASILMFVADAGVEAFGFINSAMLGLTDVVMRGFIEIEHTGKLAWAGIKTVFGTVIGEMMLAFASFQDTIAEGYKAIGQFDVAGDMTKASMAIRMQVRDMGDLRDSYSAADAEYKKAVETHDKIIDSMTLEHQGYTKTADESRKAAESVLADIRAKDEASGGYTRKQMADMNAVSEKAIIEADARLKADQEFFSKSGMMSAEVHKAKLAEIDAAVTRFRLGSSTEIQIQAWKEKEIAKLNKATTGRTTKQLAAESKAVAVAVKRDLKAREKGVEERLKIEFGWLDKMEASTDKEIKALEKSLGVSRDAYEKYITEKTGLKELSVETEARLDEEYSDLLWKTLQGDADAFTASQKAMVEGKGFSIEALKEYDTEYSAFLAEQEAANKDIRLEFYGTAGNFSQEYYNEEINRINAHSAELAAAGVAAVDVERQKTDAILALDIKKLESSDDFVDGVALGLAKSQQDFTTWADVGLGTYQALESGLATGFSTLFDSVIKGDMDSLSGAWESLWQGMLGKVTDILGQMAAEYAAAGIAKGAMALGEFIFAEQGAFDVGRTGPGAAMAGGGIPIMAHPGESILPKELTDQVKSGIGFDEFKESLRGYFGLDEGEASSLWNQASEYKGAGASLYKAWESFDSGDNVGGIVEAMNAMSEAFETYGQQQGSQIATNIGQGLGEGAGAISAGYGAYTAFEQEDYLTAVTQSLQAVQSAISLASTVSGTTVGAGAGAALGAAGTAATGAGIGLAAWNLLSEFAGIEGGDKAPAQWGAAAGGAALGTMVGGYVGTIVGALIGGVGGTSYSVATENEFDLSDLDSWINTNRTVSGGKISALPPSVDPTWFGVAQQRYYDHLNLQALAVNQLTDTVSGELTEADAKKFQSSIDAVISGINIDSGGNYNRNRADQMVIGVGNYYWNETVDAIGSVVSGTEGLSQGRKSEILELMAGTEPAYYINPIDQPENIRRYEEERAAADPVYATWLRNKALAQEERNISGGAATGGVVVPSGEDGYLGVRKEEGIFSVAAMQWAEDVGNTILKTGGVFGGTEARFDSPGMGTPTGGADIFGGDARNAQMSELLLNDQVTRQGRTNEILESQLSESRRTNTILENIVNVLLEGDEEKIRTLKAIVAKPPGVTKYDLNPLFTMSRVYMSQPRSNFGFG